MNQNNRMIYHRKVLGSATLPSHDSFNPFKSLSQVFAVITAFVLPLSTAASEISLIASIVCCLLAGNWREQYVVLCNNPIAKMFLIFFGLFLIGLTYTAAPLSEALHMLVKYSKFLLGFFLFAIFHNKKTKRYSIFFFLLAATLTLMISFVKFFSGWDVLHRFSSDSGVFKDHIFTGFLLAFTSYCYALIAFSIKKRRWVFFLLFLLAAYNVLFINLGRSGYIVFFSLILLLAWQQFYWKGLIITALASVFLLGSLFYSSANFKNRVTVVHSEINQYDQGKVDTSTGLRLEFYKNSLKLILQHPWLGLGTGSFSRAYLNITQEKSLATANPHNEYLNIFVQFGLLGIIVLFSLFYIHWRESFRLPPAERYFAQAILMAVVVGCLFNSWLMDVTQGYFYIFFTALVFARLPKLSDRR